jgi:hypothetical protein
MESSTVNKLYRRNKDQFNLESKIIKQASQNFAQVFADPAKAVISYEPLTSQRCIFTLLVQCLSLKT